MIGEKTKHVHLGAGQLGLGLVGDLTHDAGVSTIFINHAGGLHPELRDMLSKTGVYVLRIGAEEAPKKIQNHRFLTYELGDLTAPSSQGAIEAVASADCITTAVGASNFSLVAPILLAGIKRRIDRTGDTDPACIPLLAFENRDNNSSILKDELVTCAVNDPLARGYIEEKVIPYVVIVDRVCSKLQADPTTTQVTCSVEDFYEVLICNKPDCKLPPFLEAISRNKHVKMLTPEEFSLYETRKYWLINGIHLAVATCAVQAKIVLMNHAIRRPEIRGKIERIQDEFAAALAEYARTQPGTSEDFKLASLRQYNALVTKRLSMQEDEARRILRFAEVLEERRKECPHFSEKFADYNAKLVDKLASREISQDDYGKSFVGELTCQLVSFLSPLGIGVIFRRLVSRVCQPIEILLEKKVDCPRHSLAFLMDLIKILREPERIWT